MNKIQVVDTDVMKVRIYLTKLETQRWKTECSNSSYIVYYIQLF